MTKKFICAGAGSGKTYTITNQVADMIKGGQLKAEQVIMTTFTKAAAQELREKAKKELNERELYKEAQQMEHALIGTVHSVANTFLTKYWYLLGIMPDAAAMEEDEVQAFRDHSLRGLLKPEERRFLYKYAEDYQGYDHGGNRGQVHITDVLEEVYLIDGRGQHGGVGQRRNLVSEVGARVDGTGMGDNRAGKILERYLGTDYYSWWPMHYYLASAYRELGFFEESIEGFRRVLVLQPSHEESCECLAELYMAEGDADNAEKYRKKAEIIRRNRE